jgi:hypothetical protein
MLLVDGSTTVSLMHHSRTASGSPPPNEPQVGCGTSHRQDFIHHEQGRIVVGVRVRLGGIGIEDGDQIDPVASPVPGVVVVLRENQIRGLAVTQLAPGSILPTGKVTFLDGSTMLGDADLINGQATVSVANLAVGTHALKIAYFGDVHFLASTSDVLDQVVIKYASDTVALTASNYSPFVGQPVTLTATVTGLPPGTSTPTGTVSFWRGSILLGTSELMNGQATLTVSNLLPGLDRIHAVYSGDSSYAKNTSAVVYLFVSNDMAVLVSSPNPSNLGQDVTITATVTPVLSGGKTPTGKVTFYAG